jgi:hypothetical protein
MLCVFEKYSLDINKDVVSIDFEYVTFNKPEVSKIDSGWNDAVGKNVYNEFKGRAKKYADSLTETWDQLTKYKGKFNPEQALYDGNLGYEIEKLNVR